MQFLLRLPALLRIAATSITRDVWKEWVRWDRGLKRTNRTGTLMMMMMMNMWHWRNSDGKGTSEYVSQCHSVYHKSHTDYTVTDLLYTVITPTTLRLNT